jgi:hypothetical protein
MVHRGTDRGTWLAAIPAVMRAIINDLSFPR